MIVGVFRQNPPTRKMFRFPNQAKQAAATRKKHVATAVVSIAQAIGCPPNGSISLQQVF